MRGDRVLDCIVWDRILFGSGRYELVGETVGIYHLERHLSIKIGG